jgi:hypothetical protein
VYLDRLKQEVRAIPISELATLHGKLTHVAYVHIHMLVRGSGLPFVSVLHLSVVVFRIIFIFVCFVSLYSCADCCGASLPRLVLLAQR